MHWLSDFANINLKVFFIIKKNSIIAGFAVKYSEGMPIAICGGMSPGPSQDHLEAKGKGPNTLQHMLGVGGAMPEEGTVYGMQLLGVALGCFS